MRLIFYFFILLFLTSCQPRAAKDDSTSIILAYIDLNVIQKKYDIRIYNSPPPPELKDSINQGGSIKNDSIINKLEPLHVFINDSILYSNNFSITRNPIENFSFIKDITISKKQSVFLDISVLKKRKGILLQSIKKNEFKKLYPNIYLQNNYGGLLGFQNLFFLKTATRLIFRLLT